jgi:hypothetical protein
MSLKKRQAVDWPLIDCRCRSIVSMWAIIVAMREWDTLSGGGEAA